MSSRLSSLLNEGYSSQNKKAVLAFGEIMWLHSLLSQQVNSFLFNMNCFPRPETNVYNIEAGEGEDKRKYIGKVLSPCIGLNHNLHVFNASGVKIFEMYGKYLQLGWLCCGLCAPREYEFHNLGKKGYSESAHLTRANAGYSLNFFVD